MAEVQRLGQTRDVVDKNENLSWETACRTFVCVVSRAGSQSRLMTFSEMGIFLRITSRDENSHETS